jgi:hypothetical protein
MLQRASSENSHGSAGKRSGKRQNLLVHARRKQNQESTMID